MNTLELRNILISQISQIEDTSFLSALKTIVDTKTNSQIKLTKAQYEEIQTSRSEIDSGNLKDGEVFDKEIRQWLQGK
jgi:hypothetical protein